MIKFYEVYVGNLPVAISHQNLKDLFGKVGEIVSIWIKGNNRRSTFAFVKYNYLDDARNAVKTLDKKNVDGLIIKVSLSKKTQHKLAEATKPKRDGSLLLELPKRTGKKTKSLQVRQILQKQIIKKTNDDEKFVFDYVSALKEINDNNIKCKPCEIVKIEPEKPNLQSLEDIVLRYYKPSQQKKNIGIDIDLSKNKVLNSADNVKFFNIAF